ncbi:MAG: carcinine hydrolase/isopenicillin-N N-acyltransferase family protein [Acidobacteriota bacterium]
MRFFRRNVLAGIALLFLAVFLLAPSIPACACTLWTVSGERVQGGGTLVAKNRDFTTDMPNHFEVITPQDGYRMFAMVATGEQNRRSLVGGVNEYGLAVVTATVGTISKDERVSRGRAGKLKNPTRAILTRFRSLRELLENPEMLRSLYPVFALVADSTGAVMIEASGGDYRVLPVPPQESGVHTNHPLTRDFPDIWEKDAAKGSEVRLERMRGLLDSSPGKLSLPGFTALSLDRDAGPDQSIFRVGSAPKRPRTLGTLAAWLPPAGAPVVFARLTNDGQGVQEKTFTLDAAFWKKAPEPGRVRVLLRDETTPALP